AMIQAEAELSRRTEPALLSRVRLRAQRRVLWLRRLWAAGEDPAQGGAIPHGGGDRLLDGTGTGAGAAFFRACPRGRGRAGPIADSDRAAAEDPPWPRLRDEFGLGEADLDLLMLLVAVEIEPGLKRVCGYLNDDAAACHATPLLAATLFRWAPGVLDGPGSALLRWRLARPLDSPSPWSLTPGRTVDPFLV